jgi:hypothetical protein
MPGSTVSTPGRDTIVDRLSIDLIGPAQPDETLNARPSDVYATGILWPQNIDMDPDDDGRLSAEGGTEEGSGSPGEPEEVALPIMRRPAAAGVSFALDRRLPAKISADVSCGLYQPEEIRLENRKTAKVWRRRQINITLKDIGLLSGEEVDLAPHGAPAGVVLHIRSVEFEHGTLATVTLVNRSAPEMDRDEIEKATLFQTAVVVRAAGGAHLIARPSRRAIIDGDDQSAALLYRNAFEYAAGHTCAADWGTETADAAKASDRQRSISWVGTSWLPAAIVPEVNRSGHQLFSQIKTADCDPLSAQWLSTAATKDLRDALFRLVTIYRSWLEQQKAKASSLPKEFKKATEINLNYCEDAARRMQTGAELICDDEKMARAFRLANLAMRVQHLWNPESEGKELRWFPFQLGFLLLTAASAADRESDDRGIMDLLWFPTGGGKTEAYLALIAFVAFYRRLTERDPDDGAGVAAIMRYTLRLLTAQQFVRASAVIFACEAIRRGLIPKSTKPPDLGSVPFSIGLWVGGDAAPNRRVDAYASLKGDGEKSSPKQLLHCPVCQGKLRWEQTAPDAPVNAVCPGEKCIFGNSKSPLPVWTVDDDIYEFKPTLIIGTVDKFAQIVRRAEVHNLFSIGGSRGPDLIIQDELHLISGPLGTMVGLYETALDLMFSAHGHPPKIIGSTATIRRAPEQVKALFNRSTCQFPPPAIDYEDSGFAVLDWSKPGRRYVGIASAGRSAKYTLQAVAASLLQSGSAAFATDPERDPYWTLVSYFNSLRELGGSLVLMQDDVHDSLRTLAALRNETAREPGNIEELTSRRTQEAINEMLDALGVRTGDPRALDVVLATNMLSVGVNIPRLGLMLVYGQPKGIAEYIQATSRVGRGNVSGLIVTVLNSAKARDRSHFETFRTWHSTLYRDVEATSVTPFASRARDRALHAVLVALVRHLAPGMLSSPRFTQEGARKADELIASIVSRAKDIDDKETDVEQELLDKLEAWRSRSVNAYWNDARVKDSLLQSAERAATQKALGRNPGDAWPTMNNMRSVEAATPFRLADRLRPEN